MSKIKLLGIVREKSTNKKFEVFYEIKKDTIYLRNYITGEKESVTKRQEKQLKRRFSKKYRKYKVIDFINQFIIKNAVNAIVILTIMDYWKSYQKVILDIPRIIYEYEFNDTISEEDLLDDLKYFIYKNDNLTYAEKDYLVEGLEDFMKDYRNEISTTALINAYNQLANVDLSFLPPRYGEKTTLTTNGEYSENANRVTIYKDEHGTIIHEMMHSMFKVEGGFGLSLSEGYSAAVKAEYSGKMYYPIQNEYLLVLSQILGEDTLRYYLDNANYTGLCSKLSEVSNVSYEYIYKLIDDMDIFMQGYYYANPDPNLYISINRRLYALATETLGASEKNSIYFQNLITHEFSLLSPFYADNKCYEILYKDTILSESSLNSLPCVAIVNDANQYDSYVEIVEETLNNELYNRCNDIINENEILHNDEEKWFIYLMCHSDQEEIFITENVPMSVYEEEGKYYHFYPADNGTGEISYIFTTSTGELQPFTGYMNITNLNINGSETPVFLVEISNANHIEYYQNADITIKIQEKVQTLTKNIDIN